LSAYQTQLVLQQAQLTALDTVIGQIQEGLSQAGAEAGTQNGPDTPAATADIPGTIASLMGILGSGTDEQLTEEELASIRALCDTLDTGGYDTAALRAATTRSEASAIMAGLSDAPRVAPEIDPEADDTTTQTAQAAQVLSMLASYNAERESLLVEMEVTKAVIAGYEEQLRAMGVTYTDIEAAKLQAASSFGFAQAQIAAGESQLEAAQAQLDAAKEQLKSAREQMVSGQDALEDGQKKIDDGWESYYEGLETFEKQGDEARRNANADQLLSISTLAQLIYAQNFEMPAGYLDDESDNAWLLKIGQNFESVEELEDLVLVNIDKIGDVKLRDVATVTIIDNSDTTYTRLNNEAAVVLSVFKSSTSGTNEVSKTVLKEADRLQKQFPGLSILVVVDQGDYIDLIVKNVVQNMIMGAGLAILILAIFLRDFMPTLVVAIGIPLSVLTALIAMYFTNVSLNMMSLSGMALGIGMLVDNSIVVMENVYRLRGRGISAPRAAVQGTMQVAGAIIASTLTTVCVFFPMVYTQGMVRELMMPMSLTIIFCLMASLLVSMTVVPAASSTLMRRSVPKAHPFFDRVQDLYGRTLAFCLRFKAIPLAAAIGLLALSIYLVVRMGIVMIPDMTSNQIQVNLTFPEDAVREDCYAASDEAISRILEIDGVGSVAVMTGGGESLLVSAAASRDDYTHFSFMLTTENPDAGSGEVRAITDRIERDLADLGAELTISTGMSEMTNFLGSGLSVSIYGNDSDELLRISREVMELVERIPGYTEISNGQEDAAQVLHLYIDKNRAMRDGFSVAQIYQQIAGKMTTSASSVKVQIDGVDMDLNVVTNIDPLMKENILDYSFLKKTTDEKGNTTSEDIPLSRYARIEVEDGVSRIARENQSHYITVTASVEEGYNTTLLTRQLEPLLESYELPDGYTLSLGGEYETVNQMITQMALVFLLGAAFIYLVMVAQFQSLLSPFIVLFTIPLAFTGGLLALWLVGENMSIISLMGFLVLLGTVVNNGIVFVDYANQLRIGGLARRDALIATGKTRMRPILMTALTTILAESGLIFGDDMSAQMGRGMALVIAGGLAYATLMTLYIIPVMYDILFKRAPLAVDIGSENLDDVPDDAAEFLATGADSTVFEKVREKRGKRRRKAKDGTPEETPDEMTEETIEAVTAVEEIEGKKEEPTC
ncbi:MAG: efflux RND transporter permease subunit, partial [Lachnospiraceae bacterium]|nr:efflux RND transporter permease subunit [Lachnospiraceae bacterium]